MNRPKHHFWFGTWKTAWKFFRRLRNNPKNLLVFERKWKGINIFLWDCTCRAASWDVTCNVCLRFIFGLGTSLFFRKRESILLFAAGVSSGSYFWFLFGDDTGSGADCLDICDKSLFWGILLSTVSTALQSGSIQPSSAVISWTSFTLCRAKSGKWIDLETDASGAQYLFVTQARWHL